MYAFTRCISKNPSISDTLAAKARVASRSCWRLSSRSSPAFTKACEVKSDKKSPETLKQLEIYGDFFLHFTEMVY